MNDKVYANYLMHGRTKGSRNGISTTKGYTAVGQKAKGKYVNGKWVYDDYSYHPSRNMWQQQAAATASKGTIPQNYTTKQYIHSENKNLNNKWNSQRAGAQNNWQQQAASQQYKDQQKRSAYADTLAKGASNNWQQQANKAASRPTAGKQTNIGASQQAELERWKKQNQNAIAAKKKRAEAFVKATPAWDQGYKYPVSDIANKTRDVNQHMNSNWKNNTTYGNITVGTYSDASKIKDKERRTRWIAERDGIKKGDNQMAAYAQEQARLKNDAFSKSKSNAKNNWQQQANAQRAMKEYTTKAAADRKAKAQAEKVKAGAANNWQQQASERAALGQQRIRNENRTSAASAKGAANNWQEMGNQRRAANEAFVKAGTGKSKTADIRGMDREAREEATVRYLNDAVSTAAKYRKQQSDLYGAGDAKTRNARSDVRNAYEDAKLEAKNAFLAAKEKAGAKLYTKLSNLSNKYVKKKKKK